MTHPSPPPWDYIAKLVCIGDSSTGKSSLTIRLCEDRFTTAHDVTIGVEFGSRIVPVGPPPPSPLTTSSSSKTGNAKPSPAFLPPPPPYQKHMKLSLWDTAGQETYKSITRSYFRGASGALLVFDITRRATFEHATEWLRDLRQIAEEGIEIVLVGNKSDLTTTTSTTLTSGGGDSVVGGDNQRAVTVSEAEEWCRQNNILRYVETSAKSGDGVERAFLEVAERIYANIEKGKYDLADRRSGVRGPGSSAAAGGGGGGLGGRGGGSVNLGAGAGGGTAGWGRGCC